MFDTTQKDDKARLRSKKRGFASLERRRRRARSPSSSTPPTARRCASRRSRGPTGARPNARTAALWVPWSPSPTRSPLARARRAPCRASRTWRRSSARRRRCRASDSTRARFSSPRRPRRSRRALFRRRGRRRRARGAWAGAGAGAGARARRREVARRGAAPGVRPEPRTRLDGRAVGRARRPPPAPSVGREGDCFVAPIGGDVSRVLLPGVADRGNRPRSRRARGRDRPRDELSRSAVRAPGVFVRGRGAPVASRRRGGGVRVASGRARKRKRGGRF